MTRSQIDLVQKPEHVAFTSAFGTFFKIDLWVFLLNLRNYLQFKISNDLKVYF